jgi:hypothetical protein
LSSSLVDENNCWLACNVGFISAVNLYSHADASFSLADRASKWPLLKAIVCAPLSKPTGGSCASGRFRALLKPKLVARVF